MTLSLIADAANISAEGKLNVLGRFGMLYTSSLPARHPSMALVLELESSAFDAGQARTIEVILSDPDGRELSRVSATATLTQPAAPGPITNLMVMDFRDLTFEKAGPYSFKVSIDGVDAERTVDFGVALLAQGGQT